MLSSMQYRLHHKGTRARAQGPHSQGGPEGTKVSLTHLFSKHFCRADRLPKMFSFYMATKQSHKVFFYTYTENKAFQNENKLCGVACGQNFESKRPNPNSTTKIIQ